MRIVLLSLFLIAFVFDSNSQGLAIENVNVVNVTGSKQLSTNQTMLVNSFGRIEKIGSARRIKIPSSYAVVDGTDKFLIPGLWDMHVHLSYYGEEALQMLIDNGVTYVRDMGGDLNQVNDWRSKITAEQMTGPMIFRAGPFVDGPKNMDAQRRSFTKVVETAEDGKAVVRELGKLSVDFIKIHSRVPREAFFAIANEAKESSMPLMVHAPRDVSVTEISIAGARSIEHTESLLGSAIYEDDDALRDSLTDAAFERLETDPVFSILKKNDNYYNPTAISIYLLKGTEYEKKLGPRLLPLITKLHKAGVPLLTGSDFGVKEAGIVPGKDLHGELELFVQAGLTPMESLRAATINAAKCMKTEQVMGSISVGKRGDFVLLEANPLTDIRNTRKITKVIVNGKVFK